MKRRYRHRARCRYYAQGSGLCRNCARGASRDLYCNGVCKDYAERKLRVNAKKGGAK